ncbi:MAG: hypothetical protein GY851_27235 [bacterium]|nr:hypothetical protein [bacterium]
MKTIIGLVVGVSLLLVSGGCGGRAQVQQSFSSPAKLIRIQGIVQGKLDALDADLAAAAESLAGTGLSGAEARAVLEDLCGKHAYAIDVCTIDTSGRMVTVFPEEYTSAEGTDISGQAQVAKMIETKQPVMSGLFRAVEGMRAVDIQHPIMTSDDGFIGSVSMLIRPAGFLARSVAPSVRSGPWDCWAMDTTGVILYDADEEEIGRNLFTDPMYLGFPEVVELGRGIAAKPSGEGSYRFLSSGLNRPVKKRAFWLSAGLHGTEWRIVLVREIQ